MDDEGDIATALLLGCEFYCDQQDPPGYFVHGDNDNLHPLERLRKGGHTERLRKGGHSISSWAWYDKAALARDYIKFTLGSNNGA